MPLSVMRLTELKNKLTEARIERHATIELPLDDFEELLTAQPDAVVERDEV